ESGPFGQRLFTFKEYGLLDTTGSGHRVSDLFLTMRSQDRGEPGFKRAAVSAIRHSDVFSSILDEFQSKLPPISNLASRLETQRPLQAAMRMKTPVSQALYVCKSRLGVDA